MLLAWILPLLSMAAWATDDLMASQLVDEARQWKAKGRNDLASDVWQKILISNPQHGEALVNLGLVQALEGNLDEAQRLYSRARKLQKTPSGLPKLAAILAPPQSSVKPLVLKSAPTPTPTRSPKVSKLFTKRSAPHQTQSITLPEALEDGSLNQKSPNAAVADIGIKPTDSSKNFAPKPRPCRIPHPLPAPT